MVTGFELRTTISYFTLTSKPGVNVTVVHKPTFRKELVRSIKLTKFEVSLQNVLAFLRNTDLLTTITLMPGC